MNNIYVNPITGLEVYHKVTKQGLNLYVAESISNYHIFKMIVKYGSSNKKYRNIDNNIIDILPGTAHLIEHLTFNAIEKNNTEHLLEYFKRMCVYTNAYTALDSTVYILEDSKSLMTEECISKFIKNILNPRYTSNYIERELKIIEAEAITYNRQLASVTKLYSNLLKKLGLEKNAIGDVQELASLKPLDLYKLHDIKYTPKNTSLVYYIAPAKDKKQYIKILEDMEKMYFKNLPKKIEIYNDFDSNIDTIDYSSKEETTNEIRWLKIYKNEKNTSKLEIVINILKNILLDSLEMEKTPEKNGKLSIFPKKINNMYINTIVASKYENEEEAKKDIEYIKNLEITEQMLLEGKRSLLKLYINVFDYQVDSIQVFEDEGNVFDRLNILKDITLEELVKLKDEILTLEDYIKI